MNWWPTKATPPGPAPDERATQDLCERMQAVAHTETAGVIINAALNLIAGLCVQVGVSRATLLTWSGEIYDAHASVSHDRK